MKLPIDLPFLMPKEVITLFSSTWRPIAERFDLPARISGNYLIAWSRTTLTGTPVLPDQVIYVGMSNDKEGVRRRINTFVRACHTQENHSGGRTFYKNNLSRPPEEFQDPAHLYFVALTMECIVNRTNRTAKDLLVMGQVCLPLFIDPNIIIRVYIG